MHALAVLTSFFGFSFASSRQFLGETYKNTTLDSSLVYKRVESKTLLQCFDHCSFRENNCRFVAYDLERLECSLVEDGPLSDLPGSKILSLPKSQSLTGRLVPYEGGIPHDCEDVGESNAFRLIQPRGHPSAVLVICDNGWTVIQKRFNGSVDFNRTWRDYKQGFGNLKGEFWLGNEIIHKITTDGNYKMNTDMVFWNGLSNSATSSKFLLMNESTFYTVDTVDYLSQHLVTPFTTFDSDNDDLSAGNCAANNQGAWWYEQCAVTNPNAFYPTDGDTCDNSFDTGNKEYCMKLSSYMLLKQTVLRIKKIS